MGLVYNHKDKLGLVVLSEEETEKLEDEFGKFVMLGECDRKDGGCCADSDGGCDAPDSCLEGNP